MKLALTVAMMLLIAAPAFGQAPADEDASGLAGPPPRFAPDLNVPGPALNQAARTPANASPTDTMSGNTNAITCRLDPGHSDRHLTAIACARNSYWAWYKVKWRNPLSPTPAPP